MIRLQRAAKPRALQRGAARAVGRLEKQWTEGESPVVKGGLYNHQEVKAALRRSQHDKCAYCEAKDIRSPGAVEHYRPKSGWKQTRKGKIAMPGYYWLAFEWTNLLFSCSLCNDSGHKGSYFPLENPRERATVHARDCRKERPLLLDPYGAVDPEDHIGWDAYIPRGRGGSVRGRETIEVFGLARDRLLIDDRRSLLKSATGAVWIAEEETQPGSPERLAMREVLLTLLDGTQPYTAMYRAGLGERIRAL